MIGTSFNQYHITASIGAGGMGEVFRARDTRLNRDVAVKVLPKDFAADADRLRRFEQEAKTLATLNHPNILTIHDAGVHEGVPYLVGELLEGKTLREVLGTDATTALPLRKATEYALQIARGLAAAHGKGVVHRDLKPENIFVTQDGRVKILDFGLAKLRNPSAVLPPPFPLGGERDGVRGESDVPTLRIEADTIIDTTEPGMVLGTPAYMSPEQVRGEPADHRADIFAFGCVLYEMLSGTRAFRRATPVESMNAVLREEPPELSALNANVPSALERVLRRCLEKQPDNRFQSAKDLAFAIENSGTMSTSSLSRLPARAAESRFSFPHLLPWTVAALAVAFGLVVLLSTRREPSVPFAGKAGTPPLRKFELIVPPPTTKNVSPMLAALVISPDGEKFAYVNGDGLWVRWLNHVAPAVLLVSAPNLQSPFWSPQSTDVGYFDGRKLMRAAIAGGQPTSIWVGNVNVRGNGNGAGGAWFGDGQIFFTTGHSNLYRVEAKGGEATSVLSPTAQESDFRDPSPLPGGQGVVFIVHRKAGPPNRTGSSDTIAMWSPSGGRKDLSKMTQSELRFPAYSASGHLVFERADLEAFSAIKREVWAVPFSLGRFERTGEPFPVIDAAKRPSVSADGTLLLDASPQANRNRYQMVWVDRSGKITEPFGPTLEYLMEQRLSRDGNHVVFRSGQMFFNDEDSFIWSYDIRRGTPLLLNRSREHQTFPYWFPDGGKVLFSRWRMGANPLSAVVAQSADGVGAEEKLLEGTCWSLSRSGKYLLMGTLFVHPLRFVELANPEHPPLFLPPGLTNSFQMQLSPDDSLLAYNSNETGQQEIYVIRFPGFTNKTPISRGAGGVQPQWRPDGSELFYLSSDRRTMMSAQVQQDPSRPMTEPTKVFDLPEAVEPTQFDSGPVNPFDVTADGQRFLMVRRATEGSNAPPLAKLTVMFVENWFEEFRKKK